MREATIHLSNDALASLGLAELVAVFRAAGLRDVRELACRRPGCLLVVAVDEPVAEDDLDAADLEWWERIDTESGATYLCKIAVPAFDDGLTPYSETDVASGGMDVTDEGIDVTMVGDHEAFSERVGEYDELDVDVLLRQMTDYDGPNDPLDAVTTRQREVLEAAVELGYFEVPREATTEDVGAALGVDPSTVREHLQRAQRNLFNELLNR